LEDKVNFYINVGGGGGGRFIHSTRVAAFIGLGSKEKEERLVSRARQNEKTIRSEAATAGRKTIREEQDKKPEAGKFHT